MIHVYILFVVSIIILFSIYKPFLGLLNKVFIVKEHKNILDMLQIFEDDAWEEIYLGRILVFHRSGADMDENIVKSMEKEYVQLLKRYIGPNISEVIIDYFGDSQSFLAYVLMRFKNKLFKSNATHKAQYVERKLDYQSEMKSIKKGVERVKKTRSKKQILNVNKHIMGDE